MGGCLILAIQPPKGPAAYLRRILGVEGVLAPVLPSSQTVQLGLRDNSRPPACEMMHSSILPNYQRRPKLIWTSPSQPLPIEGWATWCMLPWCKSPAQFKRPLTKCNSTRAVRVLKGGRLLSSRWAPTLQVRKSAVPRGVCVTLTARTIWRRNGLSSSARASRMTWWKSWRGSDSQTMTNNRTMEDASRNGTLGVMEALNATVAGGRAAGERCYQCDHGNSDHNNEY